MGKDKADTAEEVLVKSLRTAPADPQLLVALGQLYVATEDWSRADQVAQTLLGIDATDAQSAGKNLKANILQAQNKTDEAVQYLEGLISQGQADLGARLAIVRNYLVDGDTAAAKSYIDNLLSETPSDAGVRFIAAAVDAATGDVAKAEATYKELLAEDQSRFQVWVALFRIQVAQGKSDEATATVDAAMKIFPDNPTLDWIRAGELERDGKPEEAIAIYEKMYAANSDNLIIANNLASLLATVRTDAASLDRAYTIARRLRGSDVAPYQDTYGWVALLRGDAAEAVAELEPAATGLPNDPTVQYHLAKAYLAVERPDDALVQFKKVLALTSEADSRSFVEDTRAEIARLEKVSTTPSSE
jgi:tetratricopeptide (TPR) repeat protein